MYALVYPSKIFIGKEGKNNKRGRCFVINVLKWRVFFFFFTSKRTEDVRSSKTPPFKLLYAVKAQTSLASLSWCGPLRLVHANLVRTCTNVSNSRFQSYAKSRRLHAIANEIDMRNLQRVNRIPGIHDNGPPRTTL